MPATHPLFRIELLSLTLCATLGCRTAPASPEDTPDIDLEGFFQKFSVVGGLVLAESTSVVTVNPMMFQDPQGGFLVVENGEEQLRVYGQDGELLDLFGPGTGKGESIRAPTGVTRLPGGTLVATTLRSDAVSVIPASGHVNDSMVSTGIRPLEGVQAISDRSVVLTGADAPYPKTLLHLFDLSTGSLITNFFPRPRHVDSNVVLQLGRLHLDVRGPRLAAVHSLSDTVFLFDLNGRYVSQYHVPIESFRIPRGGLPNIDSRQERQRWLDQWTLLWGVFFLDDKSILVQSVKGRRTRPTYGLVLTDTSGKVLLALSHTPKLVGAREGKLFFQDPHFSEPNRLLVATLRNGTSN